MNDLYNYLSNKCMEKVSVELAKQAILEDTTLSSAQKQNWISLINTMTSMKNVSDMCKFFSGKI